MKHTVLILLLAVWVLSACVQTVPSIPTFPPGNAIQTAVVQTLTAQPTSIPPTPTSIPATATAIPTQPTATLPSPTATVALPTPTVTPIPPSAYQGSTGQGYVPVTQAPADFIRYYYGQINFGNYPLTWSLLDANFINNNNNASQGGYASYVAYWDTVTHVNVQGVTIQSLGNDTATVTVYAIYSLNSGVNAGYTSTYNLIYSYSRSTWLFDS